MAQGITKIDCPLENSYAIRSFSKYKTSLPYLSRLPYALTLLGLVQEKRNRTRYTIVGVRISFFSTIARHLAKFNYIACNVERFGVSSATVTL